MCITKDIKKGLSLKIISMVGFLFLFNNLLYASPIIFQSATLRIPVVGHKNIEKLLPETGTGDKQLSISLLDFMRKIAKIRKINPKKCIYLIEIELLSYQFFYEGIIETLDKEPHKYNGKILGKYKGQIFIKMPKMLDEELKNIFANLKSRFGEILVITDKPSEWRGEAFVAEVDRKVNKKTLIKAQYEQNEYGEFVVFTIVFPSSEEIVHKIHIDSDEVDNINPIMNRIVDNTIRESFSLYGKFISLRKML
ncbi:MAG: hypothetical protein KKD11_00950 [Candidatus Omnitrophica bacterium]|nr:hypothetical protein [Candidatus Omnitrophota bacterium]